MQKRHTDRKRYFDELATTSNDFYVRYVKKYMSITSATKILEIGCGEGGNLLPFAKLGAKVIGIDLSKDRIEQARIYFAETSQKGEFCDADFLNMPSQRDDLFDIVLVHDVIEHIEPSIKRAFISRIKMFIKDDGIIFFRFPAWLMPFGGHQQICKSKFLSKIPFIHLLPPKKYRWLLYAFGENKSCVEELLSIKRSKMTIEKFESLCQELEYQVLNRTLWFINPHYKVKFNIPAIKLNSLCGHVPYLRDIFSTSCFYIITPQKT